MALEGQRNEFRVPIDAWVEFSVEKARILAEQEVEVYKEKGKRYKRTTWLGLLPPTLGALLGLSKYSGTTRKTPPLSGRYRRDAA